MIKEKLIQYILHLAQFDSEPLHVIIPAVIDEGLCNDKDEVVEIIVELFNKGYLLAETHSGKSGDKYIRVDKIEKSEIMSNINERIELHEYPRGIEYFFKTTKKGYELIEDKKL